MEREEDRIIKTKGITARTILLGVVPFAVIGAMIVFLLTSPGMIFQSSIKPLPEISIEKVELSDGSIEVFVRNTGPSEITIAQADVNNRARADIG
jgi:zinc transporter, ZIP family